VRPDSIACRHAAAADRSTAGTTSGVRAMSKHVHRLVEQVAVKVGLRLAA